MAFSASTGLVPASVYHYGRAMREVAMPTGEFRFVFYARDYDATVAFYRDGLGLPIVDGWDRGPEDRGALFAAAAGIIEVVHARGRPFSPPEGSWLLFEVEDVAARYRRARERGLPIQQALV